MAACSQSGAIAVEFRTAINKDGHISSFTDPQQEYAAYKTGAIFVPLLSHTPIRVTGTDRLEFLHGQISNDVKGLTVGAWNESLMLNHKGHAKAQLKVFRRDEDVFLSVEGTKGAFVRSELERHIIFDQVELADLSGNIISFSLQGPKAAEVLKAVFEDLPTDDRFLQVPFQEAKVLVCSAKRCLWGGQTAFILIVTMKPLRCQPKKLQPLPCGPSKLSPMKQV